MMTCLFLGSTRNLIFLPEILYEACENGKKRVIRNKELELFSWLGCIHNEVNKGNAGFFFLLHRKQISQNKNQFKFLLKELGNIEES